MEQMEFDVVIVGGGPAGLSAAIRLGQLSQQHNLSLAICVIDKGPEVGSQLLSGAALETRALNELLPNWKDLNPPLMTPITKDQFLFLTKNQTFHLPVPPQLKNHGNYIISLDIFARWLAQQAEKLGVNIFPGFAGTELLYGDDNEVRGVIIGAKGIDKQGQHTARYQPPMALLAKQTFIAEGCRGSLSRVLMDKYQLREACDPQTYALGIKEVWEIPKELHQPGLVMHSFGWPLARRKTYGGAFLYHFGDNLLSLGLAVGLDYHNPYLNPYEEFQALKMHPYFKKQLDQGKRIAYGARALNEGGLQSIPKLTFPGGLLIGCAAGFLNVPKIKGIHNAMKSGMVAAESVFENLNDRECFQYASNLKNSWTYKELYRARNIRPAMNAGLLPGLMYAAIDTYLFAGHAPWTFHYKHRDCDTLALAAKSKKIEYPKHDGKLTFDLMTSVFLTNNQTDENQPCHLKLKNPDLAIAVNYKMFASPEQRYCPAGVYEIVSGQNNQPYLQINASNCIQCKACDIKDPKQNIVWTPPEGGSGPAYEVM